MIMDYNKLQTENIHQCGQKACFRDRFLDSIHDIYCWFIDSVPEMYCMFILG